METDREGDTWKKFISDGDKYLKTAVNGCKNRKTVFTPNIIYNIVSMSIENYIMGYLFYHNHLPDNHTLIDLINGVKEISEVDDDLYKKVIHMNRFQEAICSLSAHIAEVPEEKDLKEFLTVGETIHDFVKKQIPITHKH